MAPARTGSLNSNKNTVTSNLQINKGVRSHPILAGRIIRIVTIKFKELAIEDTPARCKEKITKSNLKLLKPSRPDKGGYKVHPTPGPNLYEKYLIISKIKLKGITQNENLFNRGKTKSPTIKNKGTIQLPKPPIRIGITKKKIISRACDVTIEL